MKEMSTNPAAAQAGGKPLSHGCGADPETCGNYHDSAESELQSVPAGTAGDGAETAIPRMAAARYMPVSRHRLMSAYEYEAGDGQHKEQEQQVAAQPSKPSEFDVPPPPSMPSESDVPPPPPDVLPSQRKGRSEQPPLDFRYAGPGGLPLPPPGSTYVRPNDGAAPPHRAVLRLSSARTTDESVSTLARPRARRPPYLSLEHREAPAALWFTACCILFWLLALAIGFALLVVYLRHHLQPPRMRVTMALLRKNSSNSLGGQEATYSLTIHADIYNPNTKLLHVVLRCVPLDLYFNGNRIGTGAVWPVLPIHEAPGDSSTVQLLGSVTQVKDVASWQKATNHSDGGVSLELRLVGTFCAQLNIGRWIPSSFRFWVYSRCTLWLDPPNSLQDSSRSALRRSRCSPEYLIK